MYHHMQLRHVFLNQRIRKKSIKQQQSNVLQLTMHDGPAVEFFESASTPANRNQTKCPLGVNRLKHHKRKSINWSGVLKKWGVHIYIYAI